METATTSQVTARGGAVRGVVRVTLLSSGCGSADGTRELRFSHAATDRPTEASSSGDRECRWGHPETPSGVSGWQRKFLPGWKVF